MNPLRVLAYVDAVARSGSIRKAADQLHISSTALNRTILALERDLGAPLFERLQNGVRPSAAGEAYILFARRTLGEAARLRSEVEDLRGLRRGRVSVATIQSVAGTMLPAAIGAYQALHPGVSFNVAIAGNDSVLAALAADEVELGIAFNAPPGREITVLAGIEQSFCAVMAADHDLAGRGTIALHDCLRYHWASRMPHVPAGRRSIECCGAPVSVARRRSSPTVSSCWRPGAATAPGSAFRSASARPAGTGWSR